MQKIFLTSGLIITCLLSIVFAQNKKKYPVKQVPVTVTALAPVVIENNNPTAVEIIASVPDAPVPAAPVPDVSVSVEKIDTLPTTVLYNESSMEGIFHKTVDGKRYELVVMKNKVTELYIDGEGIADNKISGYQNITDKIVKEVREEMEKAKKDAEGARQEASVARIDANQSAQQAYVAKVSAEDARRQADQSGQQNQRAYMLADAAGKEASETKEQAEMAMEQAQVSKVEAEEAREKSEADKILSENLLKEIGADLMKDGIIKNNNPISFSLNKDELIVNGTRQPQAMQEKYKKKYLVNATSRIEFSGSANSKHVSIQSDK